MSISDEEYKNLLACLPTVPVEKRLYNKPFPTKHGTFQLEEHPLFAMADMQMAMPLPKPRFVSPTMQAYNTAPSNTNTQRGYEAAEPKEQTMSTPNKIAIHSTAHNTIEVSNGVYYMHDKSIVVRQSAGLGLNIEPYKLAEFKSKLSMDNATVLQLASLVQTDLIPAPAQTLEVQELVPGCAVLLREGWGFVISATESKELPNDVTVRYITVDGTLRVETIALESYTTAVLPFDSAIYGSPAFKKFVFEEVLVPINIITNGNVNRALTSYRILDKVELLGEKRTTDLLNSSIAEACYRTW